MAYVFALLRIAYAHSAAALRDVLFRWRWRAFMAGGDRRGVYMSFLLRAMVRVMA